jgi:hypothetical protein
MSANEGAAIVEVRHSVGWKVVEDVAAEAIFGKSTKEGACGGALLKA